MCVYAHVSLKSAVEASPHPSAIVSESHLSMLNRYGALPADAGTRPTIATLVLGGGSAVIGVPRRRRPGDALVTRGFAGEGSRCHSPCFSGSLGRPPLAAGS